MNEHRYILEPYKGMQTRYHCPNCSNSKSEKTFVCYIDKVTGEHIHPSVGRCNRESNCGYHYTPKQYFNDNNIFPDKEHFKPHSKIKTSVLTQKQPSFIPYEIFKASLKSHESNNFIKFLIDLFSVEIVNELISKYFIGTSKHWPGSTVFWQIDITGKVRTGKIMLYDPVTGKRIKVPFNHITWAHTALQQHDFELKQCLFGEHLLKDRTKPVAIVESEKTAIIASAYLPQFLWLAVGSLTNLNAEKCKVLSGRTITLFPDLNGFKKWSNKANELSHIAKFNVSTLLEQKATEAERKQGFDLADYLIRFNYSVFSIVEPKANENAHAFQPIIKHEQHVLDELPCISFDASLTNHDDWNDVIYELETYFASIKLPSQPIKLNPFSTITDTSKYIQSHLLTVKANNGKQTYLPYLNRLQELKQYLIIYLN